jgi:polyferredoxin
MILPFALLARDKKKTWCQNYCPRASLFQTLFKGRSLTGKIGPNWLIRGKAKWVILGYFSINLFILAMSSVMVFKGSKAPLEKIRFLLAFQLPWEIPQFLKLGAMPNGIVHLSFRMYSMMFTTTVIGLILALIFKPRTWCTVCPINTISDISLKKIKQKV